MVWRNPKFARRKQAPRLRAPLGRARKIQFLAITSWCNSEGDAPITLATTSLCEYVATFGMVGQVDFENVCDGDATLVRVELELEIKLNPTGFAGGGPVIEPLGTEAVLFMAPRVQGSDQPDPDYAFDPKKAWVLETDILRRSVVRPQFGWRSDRGECSDVSGTFIEGNGQISTECEPHLYFANDYRNGIHVHKLNWRGRRLCSDRNRMRPTFGIYLQNYNGGAMPNDAQYVLRSILTFMK